MFDPITDREIPSVGPYSHLNRLTVLQRRAHHAALAEGGIRLMPFGFASAVSVVSDIDASTRQRYAGYVGMLIDQLGLDFGDSTWLYSGLLEDGREYGMAFFSSTLSLGRADPPESFTGIRTFNEGVAEYHKGHVDHFHAFYFRGPRVLMVDTFEPGEDAGVELCIGPLQTEGRWHTGSFFVQGVSAAGEGGASLDLVSVTVRDGDGLVTSDYAATPHSAPEGGPPQNVFVLKRRPEDERPVPRLDKVASVILHFSSPQEAAKLRRVFLLSSYGDRLIDRLSYLREVYGVEMGLITEHSFNHFRNPHGARIDDLKLRQRVAEFSECVEAYNGRLAEDDGTLIFSTDSDDPHSYARVFPEISRRLMARFVVPAPAASAFGWDPLELVTPTPTRSGGALYWAHRTLPNVVDPPPGRKYDSHSRQDTFAARMTRTLEHAERQPGLCWPIYTHLGGIVGAAEAKPMPSPYFDAAAMEALQDRVFNITGHSPPEARVWFARASVLYEYALMLRSIVAHVTRPDPDSIHIGSWEDPILERRVPSSAEQLYGLTFYVPDPARASVWLDGRRIERIVRNAPDITGKGSVTIAECGIRHIVFERLDPLANAPAGGGTRGGLWSWSEDGGDGPFGRLSVTASGRRKRPVARLEAPLHGWTPAGAQLLGFAVNPDEDARFAVVLRTTTGGVFFFGDKTLAKQVSEITAAVHIDPLTCPPGKWSTLTLPFHQMVWAAGSEPGGPMPSHPLATVELLSTAAPGAGVAFARMLFLRPRATVIATDAGRGFCVGGRLASGEPGAVVRLAATDGDEVRSVESDQVGWFCFDGVKPGVYRLWAPAESGDRTDRRGRLFEVGADVANLVLS